MPLSRLSKANIKRARRIVRREYPHASAARKNRLVFGIAWDIQKGRMRRHGHR